MLTMDWLDIVEWSVCGGGGLERIYCIYGSFSEATIDIVMYLLF